MGGGQEKSSTQVTKVELPKWVDDAAQENYRLAQSISWKPHQPYAGERVAGINPTTQSAIEYLTGNIGKNNDSYSAAQNALSSLMNFQPPTIGYDRVGSRDTNVGQVGTNTVGSDLVRADIVSPKTVAASDLTPYLNPQIDLVERNALDALDRQGILNQNALKSRAASSGAFGGSRQAIMEGILGSETARQAGDLSANLRSSSFDKAMEYLTGDISRDMAAQTTNVGNRLSADTTSANNKLTADLSNANNRLDADKFNVSSRLESDTGNANRSLQAGLANQGARLSADQANLKSIMEAASLRQSAATNLTGVADASRSNTMAEVGALLNAGNVLQGNNQAKLDDEYSRFAEARDYDTERLNLLLASLGMTPYGRTETTNKTETSSGGADWATAALGGFNMLKGLGVFSEDKAKVDKQRVGHIDELDLDAWAWRYKGDPKDYPKVVGVMASEVEKKHPKAVRKIGKNRIVDYDMLRKKMAA